MEYLKKNKTPFHQQIKWEMGLLLLGIVFLNTSFNQTISSEAPLMLSTTSPNEPSSELVGPQKPPPQPQPTPPSPTSNKGDQESRVPSETEHTDRAEGKDPKSQNPVDDMSPLSDELTNLAPTGISVKRRTKNPIQRCSNLAESNSSQFSISIRGNEISKNYLGTLNFKAEIRNVKVKLSDGTIENRPVAYVCEFTQDTKRQVEIDKKESVIQGSFCDCAPKTFTLNKSIEDLAKAVTQMDQDLIKEKLIASLKRSIDDQELESDDDLAPDDEDDKEERRNLKLAGSLNKQLVTLNKSCEHKVDEVTKLNCSAKKLVQFYKTNFQKFKGTDKSDILMGAIEKFYDENMYDDLQTQIKSLNHSSPRIVETLLAGFSKQKETKEFHARILNDSRNSLEQGLLDKKLTLENEFIAKNSSLEAIYESDHFARYQYTQLRTNPTSVLTPDVQNIHLWYDKFTNGVSNGLRSSGMSSGDVTQDYNSVFSSLNPLFKNIVTNPYADINNRTPIRTDVQNQLAATNSMNLLTISPSLYPNSSMPNSSIMTPTPSWYNVYNSTVPSISQPQVTSPSSIPFFNLQNGFQSLGPSQVPPFDPNKPFTPIGKRIPGTGI